jgi:hypothetical protein
MKKLAAIIAFALVTYIVSAQSPCLPEGITFTTQAQIDNFQVNYPGCTEIEGDVEISGDDITNLEGLNVVTSIGGGLWINDNDALLSLSGLDNLESESNWSIVITNNPSLQNLQGFPKHGDSLFFFVIENNDALVSLSGLERVKTVFDLRIQNNDALVSLSGLDSLTTIILLMGWGSSLQIIDNDALMDLTGLESLTSFGNSGGGWPTSIIIEDNDVLKSLEGINNIEGWTIHNLHIKRNPLLSICEVASICNYLEIAQSWSHIEIDSNATGCNSIKEVEEACANQGIPVYKQLLFTIHPNPTDNGSITLTLDNPHNLHLTCFNTFGQQIVQQEIQSEETVINVSTWSPGIYLAVVYEDGKAVGRAKLMVR